MVVSAFVAFPIREASTTISDALFLLSGVLLVGAVIVWIKGVHCRYDLTLLEQFHEQEQLRKAETDEIDQFDSVYCMGCGEAYDVRLAYCPNCKAPQGRTPCG